MNFIGLDVGFSARRRNAGIVRLNSGVVSVGCATASLESQTALFGLDEVDVAAIDAGRYTAVGDEAHGYFFLPPWQAWAPWPRQEFETQSGCVESIEVWIDGVGLSPSEPLPE